MCDYLVDHLLIYRTSGNVISPALDSSPLEEAGTSTSIDNFPVPPAPKKKKGDNVDQALVQYLSAATTESKDSNYHFAMSLCQQLRQLTPASASYAKFRIQQLMYEVEYNMIENQFSNVNDNS